MKTSEFYLVLGAIDDRGKALVKNLIDEGHCVFVALRPERIACFNSEISRQVVCLPVEDLSDPKELSAVVTQTVSDYELDGVIYNIGHSPNTNGAGLRSLLDLSIKKYRGEIDVHQVSLLNAYHCLVEEVCDGGCFVFISEPVPRSQSSWSMIANCHHHGVVASGNWLIEGMRYDPAVTKRGIKVHHLTVAKNRSADELVQEVLIALESHELVDKEI